MEDTALFSRAETAFAEGAPSAPKSDGAEGKRGPDGLSVYEEGASPDADLRWLQLTGGIVSLIGLLGLFALLAQSAHAADSGLAPGKKAFPSPFANSGAPGGQPPAGAAAPSGGSGARPQNFFDDEDDEDFGGAPRPGAGAANPQNPQGAGAGSNPQGVSMGGTPAGGVISKGNVRAIPLDPETGEGGKELVTDFNFPDGDIMDIAKTLGKLTGKNFIFDKDVKGKISIVSNSPITVGDAWKAFLTALDMNQFALIPSGKYIRIARQRDARDKQLKTYTGDFSPDTDALITRVFPLKYIDAEEVARTFRSFMPANSRIIPYEQTNTVIVTDTGSNIAKLNKMLEILDVEGYDVGIEVVPVKYASATDLSKLIDQLIPGTGGAPTPGGAAPRFGGGGAGRTFSARRTKEGGVINTIIADDRTNTLIVHANSKGADQVRALVSKLDQKIPPTKAGGKIHVFYLQFADAEQVATTLNNLSQTATTAAKPTAPGGGAGTGVNPTTASLFEGNVKISADKSTNSLVVTASPSDWETVQRVILRLDIQRDEVFVEAIMMEIQIQKGFNFSANIVSPNSGIGSLTQSPASSNDLANFLVNPLSVGGALIGFKAGQSSTFTIPGSSTPVTVSSLQGLITAIQSTTKSNVLATPQIIALDNSEATFDQTDKIPVPQTTAIQGAGGALQSFGKENVTLSIKIKPQINKMSNFVKMHIETKLSTLDPSNVPTAAQASAIATLERSANTDVVVGDSDTIVIGGLIRDATNDVVHKIPLLGDIPILGWLFSSKSTNSTKSNLLIFLTPHIVRVYDKVRAVLDRKLKERDEFLEKNMGGEDPYRADRDKMIRNLPDIKELTSKRPPTSVTIEDSDQAPPASTNPFSGSEPGAANGGGAEPPTAPYPGGNTGPAAQPAH